MQPQSILKICSFSGENDPIEAADWIEMYDLIATDYNWSGTNKAARIGGYLRKHALVWYIEIMKVYSPLQTAWPSYKEMFARRFISAAPSERSSSTKSDVSSVSSSARS